MANELIKLKTGSLTKMNSADGGLSQVAIDRGTVYFATDSTTKAGKIWFDTADGKRIDMTAFSQESVNAITADNVTGTVAIANGGTGATTATTAKENLGLGNAKIFYGTCSTDAATVAKVVTCAEFKAADLVKGAIIFVTFNNTNSGAIANLTLNVNGTGAKPIKKIYNYTVTNLSNAAEIYANQTYSFTYDGTNWVCGNTDYNTNTTYSGMTLANLKAGSETTNRLISAANIKSAFTASDGIFQPGSADGTISIYGQDLAVTGLGSAAFTEASTYATKTELNGLLAASDAMVYKGTLAGTNTSPGTYTPAADCGHVYKVSTAGYINGEKVEAGDMLICTADSTVAATSSNYSTVKATWTIVQTNADGIVIGPASATSGHIATFDGTTGKLIKDSGYTIATSVPSGAKFTDTTYTFDGTYNASTNKAATVSTVTNAINALDGNLNNTTPGAGKTLTAFSQTDGKISATFGNISITKSQITDFPTSLAPTSHTHGNIANGGTISSTGVAIANGDYLLISDASNSGKIERTSITFDGSTATKALTQKGTWETFNNYSHPTTSGNKHIPSGGSSGQFLGWSADGTAAWVSNPNTDTKNTAGSTNSDDKLFLIGATSQAANPQTYSDSEVYTTNGTLTTKILSASAGINANTASSGTAGGVSLYSTSPDNYGLVMRNTGTSTGQMGKHGYVQGDWAGYLTFSGAVNRGWVFRHANANVASINGEGKAVFNGSVTVGGNTTNTSGVRMEYNSTTKSLDFIFA